MSFKRHLTTGIALTVGLIALTGSALAAPPSTPPGQEQKAEKQAESGPAEQNRGQEQKAAEAESSSGINATTAGVKPSNNTDKNTSCETGGSGSSTTCTRSPHGTNPPDSSKRYGNGTTAAQIATSRGAAVGTEIRGPGNSQPHKVCKKVNANGKEVWVDVHAVKSYSSTQCAPSTSATSVQSQSTVVTSGNSSNVTSTTSQTGSTATSGTAATGGVAGATGTGGVAGTAAESGSPQSGSTGAGGVLGAFGVAGVAAGGVLPFTGFPIWLAIVVAIGLIAIGWTLYHRGRPATRDLV